MTPRLALLLCIAFIITLFFIDRKRQPDVPTSLWIPLLWMMHCSSRALYWWLHPEALVAGETGNEANGSAIDRNFLIALMLVGLFILARRKVDWSKIFKNNSIILVLYIYFGFSILWSNFFDISFKRWWRTIGDLMMVTVILTEDYPLDAIKIVVRRWACVLIPFSAILIKYFRDIGVAYDYRGVTTWVGVTTHKNSLGQIASVGAVFFLWNIYTIWLSRSSKWEKRFFISFDVILLLMSLWLLRGPGGSGSSATSQSVFFIGAAIVTISRFAKANPRKLASYIFFISFLGMLSLITTEVFWDKTPLELIATSANRDTTLTGRTDLWIELINIGSRNPILGTGYGSFWIGNLANDLWSKFEWEPESAHNGYIDVYVQLGFLGLLLVVLSMIIAIKNTLKMLSVNFEYGIFQLTFLTMIVISNMTESSITKPTSTLWFIFLLVAVKINYNSSNKMLL
jgi:exopolysaccharide production protein ExoQ